MIFLPKNKLETICEGLNTLEFQCKCKHEACRSIIINPLFIEAYESFRLLIDLPLTINSGHRCTLHNFEVGGKPMSRHLSGEAVDIDLTNILDVWSIDRVLFIAKECGFRYVERYEKLNFLHVDVGVR
jgi:uncharacterized protein YcbK (DUF882 family)